MSWQPLARSLANRTVWRGRPGGNPMRRTVDRVEAWATLAMLATLVFAGPVLSWTAGWQVYRHGVAAERVEQAQRFRTQAVLVHDAAIITGAYPTIVVPMVAADARWTATDGTVHSGQVTVVAGTPAGATVTVWTDAAGEPVGAPQRHSQTIGYAIVAGALTAVGTVLLLAMARQAMRHILDRRRLAGWQTAWSAVEPQWTGRR